MDDARLCFLLSLAGLFAVLSFHIWLAARLAALLELSSRRLPQDLPYPLWMQQILQKSRRLERILLSEQLVFTILLTIFTTAAGIFAANWLLAPYELPKPLRWGCGTLTAILCSGLLAIPGVTFPRRAEQHPDTYLKKGKKRLHFLVLLFSPMQKLMAGLLRRFVGEEAVSEVVTEEEILSMVDVRAENGLLETQQKEMIGNILEFDDMDVSDVMTHRTEIVGISIDTKMMDVVYLATNENYSRMPVYRGSMDNIIGVLIVKDLLGLIGADEPENFQVEHFLREVLFVPETAKCKDVLKEMTLHNAQMAVAVDEYGGTAGIVTVEDMLEEIVGSIRDEYDDAEEEAEWRKISENVYIIYGGADPEDTLEMLGVTMPELELDTMSAFLVELLGRIPDEEETPSVEYEGIRFTVLLVEDNWIAKMKAEKQAEQAEPA